MVDIAHVRAPLFVPAIRPERFAKAAGSGADAVILDLEDSVSLEDKPRARAALSDDFTKLPVMVRVNASGTVWHDADIKAVLNHSFAAVMLPKSESPAQVASVISALQGRPIIALIESAEGLANARDVAALEGVKRLAFGSMDFCADLGCAHLRDILLPARAELVLASRLARLAPPIDGVTTQLDDPNLTQGDAEHARDIGMTGKLCIHPGQVPAVLRAFTPTDEQFVWARRVLSAAEGAARVDGAMVDEPVRQRARQILSLSPLG
jgi:citrate lyase subunit beta/citryl-CoA lyase